MAVSLERAKHVLQLVKNFLTEKDPTDNQTASFLSISTAARYLRGYKDDLKAAKYMLATHQYRCLLHTDGLGTNEDTYHTVWTELKKRNMFIATVSDGDDPPSPVLILRKKGEGFEKQDFEDYRRSFFFTLDCIAKIADQQLAIDDVLLSQTGRWVVVLDMDGYSSKNSPPWSVTIETLRIFENHFPERAKRLIILDAPFAFSMLWKMVKPIMHPVTREKFVFISRSIGEAAMEEQAGSTVYACINMDLEAGKQNNAKVLMDRGFLKQQDTTI